MMERLHLDGTQFDLGSGPRPKPGFVGIDQQQQPTDRQVWTFDLTSGAPWPIADGQATALYSSHLIEHLPMKEVRACHFLEGVEGPYDRAPGCVSTVPTKWTRCFGMEDALCWFMNEAFRVAAPGCVFELHWPALVDYRQDPPRWLTAAFVDPTHRRFIPVQSLDYFSRRGRDVYGVSQYPLRCDWRVDQVVQGELGPDLVENVAFLIKPAAP